MTHEACGKLADTWFNSKRSGIKNSHKTGQKKAVILEKNTARLYTMSDKESCYSHKWQGHIRAKPHVVCGTQCRNDRTKRHPNGCSSDTQPTDADEDHLYTRQDRVHAAYWILRSSTAHLDTPTQKSALKATPLIIIPDDTLKPGRLKFFTSAVQKLRQMKAKQATASAEIQRCRPYKGHRS